MKGYSSLLEGIIPSYGEVRNHQVKEVRVTTRLYAKTIEANVQKNYTNANRLCKSRDAKKQ